jgi:hypothetical protein
MLLAARRYPLFYPLMVIHCLRVGGGWCPLTGTNHRPDPSRRLGHIVLNRRRTLDLFFLGMRSSTLGCNSLWRTLDFVLLPGKYRPQPHRWVTDDANTCVTGGSPVP